MFLTRTILILVSVLWTAVPLFAGVYTIQGHSTESYQEDIGILLDDLQRDPSDLEARERLIHFYYATEQFDLAVTQCEEYKRRSSRQTFRNRDLEQEIDYVRIICLASSSRFDEASVSVDSYIVEYNPPDDSIKELRHRQQIYDTVERTRSFPSLRSRIAEDKIVLGTVPDSERLIVYDSRRREVVLMTINGSQSSADFLPELPGQGRLLSVSVNSVRTICMVSYRTDNGAYIRISYKQNGRWSPLFREGVFSEGSVNSYPSFHPDGKLVLFSSNRNEESGTDILFTRYTEGVWSAPEAVGDINTDRDEPSVAVHPSGLSVFFSTNGRPGLGGFDIYMARLHVRSNTVSASSITHVPSVNTFKNEVVPPYAAGGDAVMTSVDAGQSALLRVPGHIVTIEPERGTPPIRTGTFIARNLEFETGSSRLRRSAYPFLIQLFNYLKEHPEKNIHVSGHTDTTGPESVNVRLSRMRASAVRSYLVRRGIDPRRITIKGYGPSKPIAGNETSAGRQLNRRVEITISDEADE